MYIILFIAFLQDYNLQPTDAVNKREPNIYTSLVLISEIIPPISRAPYHLPLPTRTPSNDMLAAGAKAVRRPR